MKIKKQFIFLSFLIISIPILCSIFVLIHTYIHSPNRYLLKGSVKLEKQDFSSLNKTDIESIERSLKILPKDVEALIWLPSEKKVVYSTMQEIPVGENLERSEIWNYVSKTSNEYFYQFSTFPTKTPATILITRLPRKRINTEKNTILYLKVLLLIILIVIISLILTTFISRNIFKGLNKIEISSSQLAEGKLDQAIITEQSEKDQNEFITILQSLEKMRCELLEIQKRKNNFIMGISHDLRTPVAVIKGYSEAIQDNVITEKSEIKNSLELINQKAAQLESMIDTLINFMKLNDTEIKEQLVPNSITKLIKDFAKYTEVTGTIFKRRIQTNIHLERDIQIPLNEQLVQRSFENLFSNAIRYTRENDLIEIKAQEKIQKGNNFIILQIKDSGYGIEKKDLDYIFDLFYRGSNSRHEEGMGIGLAVVKNIMKTHGWEISVQSQKGRGTCFTIKIPFNE